MSVCVCATRQTRTDADIQRLIVSALFLSHDNSQRVNDTAVVSTELGTIQTHPNGTIIQDMTMWLILLCCRGADTIHGSVSINFMGGYFIIMFTKGVRT